jgi:hypothetical protein
MAKVTRDSHIENSEMTKPSQDTIVDEIISEMPLEERV